MAQNTNASGKHRKHIAWKRRTCPTCGRNFSSLGYARHRAMHYAETKSGMVTCPDCGVKYSAGAPHTMFCEAHTCGVCGSSYGYVVRQQDRTRSGEGMVRVCEDCVMGGR